MNVIKAVLLNASAVRLFLSLLLLPERQEMRHYLIFFALFQVLELRIFIQIFDLFLEFDFVGRF